MAANGNNSGPGPKAPSMTAKGASRVGKTGSGSSESQAHARAQALSAKSRGKAGGGSRAPDPVRKPSKNDGTTPGD